MNIGEIMIKHNAKIDSSKFRKAFDMVRIVITSEHRHMYDEIVNFQFNIKLACSFQHQISIQIRSKFKSNQFLSSIFLSLKIETSSCSVCVAEKSHPAKVIYKIDLQAVFFMISEMHLTLNFIQFLIYLMF